MSDSKHVYILGSIRNKRVADILRSNGLKIGFIGTNRKNAHPEIEFDDVVIFDDILNQEIENITEKIKDKNVAFFWSTNDKHVELKARLSEALGLKSQSIESALNVKTKDNTRTRLSQTNSAFNAWFRKVSSKQELEDAISNGIKYPIIVKPTNLAGSKYVFKCESRVDLDTAIESMTEGGLYEKFDIILEEFLVGEKYSIEGFVADGFFCTPMNITRAISANELGIKDFYEHLHIVPSGLSNEKEVELQNATQSVITDLGLDSCPIHAEFFLTKDGPRLIEIASRWGGLRETLYMNCYDYSFFQLEVDFQLLSKKPDWISGVDNSSFSVSRFMYPEKQGIYQGLLGEDVLDSMTSKVDVDMRAKIGQKVGLSREGYDKAGMITLTNTNKQDLGKDLEILNSSISIVVKDTTH